MKKVTYNFISATLSFIIHLINQVLKLINLQISFGQERFVPCGTSAYTYIYIA